METPQELKSIELHGMLNWDSSSRAYRRMRLGKRFSELREHLRNCRLKYRMFLPETIDEYRKAINLCREKPIILDVYELKK